MRSMLAAERRVSIARRVEQFGSVRVSELASTFGVTEETIRRDLEELEREGILRRTYGGAVRANGTGFELSFAQREEKNRELKERIARAAAALVEEGDTIALDASTTALRFARLLPQGRYTVLTNSVQVVLELAHRPGVTVMSTGGTLRETALSFVGPLAERAVQEYHVDKVFLSCKGVTLEHGLTDSNELEVMLKKRMVGAAREVIALIDSTKFGYVGFATIAPVGAVHKLVTDSGIPPEIRQALEEQGIEVIVAG